VCGQIGRRLRGGLRQMLLVTHANNKQKNKSFKKARVCLQILQNI
jgi:hypothetical protein